MPPKGWRKSADGSYPVTSKERDSISIDDILFPKATVNRLARAILQEGGLISKDSSTAIQRSSTVFVSYLLVHARQNAKKFDRKTIGAQDILVALEQAEFSSFLPTVKQELDSFQAHKEALKLRRKQEKAKIAAATASTSGEGETSTTTDTATIQVDGQTDKDEETIDVNSNQNTKETENTPSISHDPNSSNNGNETVDENDNDNDDEDTEPQQQITDEPQSKKLKTRDDTVSANED